MPKTKYKETIIRLRDGDHSAFESLFIEFFNKVKYFIKGIIRSDDDAEELAQDIFVKLWTGRESIDPEKSFNSYIYTMARNSALNFLKHKFVEDSYLKELPALPQSDNSEDIIHAKETQSLIEMTVAGMPGQRKTVYDMSRNQGKSNDEIAEELKISKKTVENQLSLALRDIRKVLELFTAFFI